MFKITDLKLLKVIKHFIVNQKYKLIITRTGADEVFLESITRKDFEVICVLKKDYTDMDEYNRDVGRISEMFKRIQRRLMKIKIKTAILYVGTNDFVKDNDIIDGIQIFKTTSGEFKSEIIQKNFPTLNYSMEKTVSDEKEEFHSVMNEIKFFSEQKQQKSIKKHKTKMMDSHRFFVFSIIAAHLIMFVIAPKWKTFQPFSAAQLANLFGASSFEMTFINGQLWRPFTSVFVNPSPLTLGIDLFIFFSFGVAVREMLGNKWYLIFIIIGSYITFFLASLFIPGAIWFGTEHLLELTLGAFIACYILERVEFIKFYAQTAKSNAFIFVFIMILVLNPISRGFMFLGVLSGFITAFAIIALKQNDAFNSISATLSISLILGSGLYFWNKIPVQNSGYLRMNRAIFTIFDDFYPEKSIKWKTKICQHYEYKIPECKII